MSDGRTQSLVQYSLRTTAYGQRRPYADTVHEGELTLAGDWYGKRPDFGRDVVKRALSGLSNIGFTKEKGQVREFHEAYLDYLTKVEPSRWVFRIVRPYVD